MQELIDNRRRVNIADKLRIATQILRQNGPAFCLVLAAYYGSSAIANKAFGYVTKARERRGLPGLNSIGLNKSIWDAWDWSTAGEEWTPSEEWKSSLIDQVLLRFMPPDGHLLEIGPGGGRWSDHLIAISKSYTGVDLSATAVEYCRQRFAHHANARFLVGSGTDLSGVGDCSVDGIWSFDVFVHINTTDVAVYLKEMRRVLKPGAIAAIHHGRVGGKLGGWRSDLTQEAMRNLIDQQGFQLKKSITEWYDGSMTHGLDVYDDVISVFTAPSTVTQRTLPDNRGDDRGIALAPFTS